jgi:acyl CoA:acetate/3-ketoacid CoA transferase beta subunit
VLEETAPGVSVQQVVEATDAVLSIGAGLTA